MTTARHTVLVVDDEPAQRQFLRAVLDRDYDVTAASNGEEARQLLTARSYDLVITDQRMPGMSGIRLLEWIRENSSETPVVVLTAHGSIDSAVEAIKLGAEDYLQKPLKSPDELRMVVSRTLEKKELRNREIVYREESETRFAAGIVAESPEMKRALKLAEQVAQQATTVLITGESGTGKEVVARHIHRCSRRAEAPFVAVNCAALTETLLESELFGHEKGAFTGAVQARPGRFELANGGSLFLDEVGETSVNLQSKLLRVLQEQQFERVGGIRTISVDVRLIAATNRNLQEAIDEKTFREDLFYRLNVFPIHLAPLRERKGDILPLVNHFLKLFAGRMGLPQKALSSAAETALSNYGWPGNIRELQNAIERAMIVSQGSFLEPSDFPFSERKAAAAGGTTSLADMEKDAIIAALKRHGEDRRATAEELGISLRTLQYRLKEYGLVKPRD